MNFCVFCGSSMGDRPEYEAAARALGSALAKRNIGVVYGGARVGLMGALADAALAEGGHVIGVIPKALVDVEIAHEGLSELTVTASMHERKAKMAELSDGFIALPGGIGTLEELFEIWTWTQLGFHRKAIGLLNVAGYYDRLLEFLDHVVEEKFVKKSQRDILATGKDAENLIDQMCAYEPTFTKKWISEDQL